MITTLNQLTNVRLLVPYHAKVTGAGSDIVAIGTSARAFSAVDNSKKDLLPNPEEMHGVRKIASCDYIDELVKEHFGKGEKTPITILDDMGEFKCIFAPYGDSEFSITLAEIKKKKQRLPGASYTCFVGSFQGLDRLDFKEIFYQMIDVMYKDLPKGSKKTEKIRAAGAWVYDY